MASLVTSFNYTVQMILVVGTKNYKIPSNGIKSITLNFDYDKNNMPSIYINIRIGSALYDKLVLNADTATISFRLFKIDRSNTATVNKPYIEDRFVYNISSDPNYNEVFEKIVSDNSIASDGESTSYLEGQMGLVSIKCINDNKRLFNDIVKNTNVVSIIHKYTKHMNMCIEPLDNNENIDQFIIPPITSITNLIEFLNDNFCLYNSGYRFFRDFNTTYLLSADGNSVEEKSNKYNTVIISIEDPLDDLSKVQSIELDRTNHAYIIHVNANDTTIKVDRTTDKKYNSIVGVDSKGNISQERLDLPRSSDSTDSIVLERVPNDNMGLIRNTKRDIESTSVLITVVKTEIDSTILTPNKEYQVKNHTKNKQYNGKYILSFKKELLMQIGEEYIGSVMFGLRKV